MRDAIEYQYKYSTVDERKENMQMKQSALSYKIHAYFVIPTMGNMQTIQSFVISSIIPCSKHEPNTILIILCEHASLLKLSLFIKKEESLSSSVVYMRRELKHRIRIQLCFKHSIMIILFKKFRRI